MRSAATPRKRVEPRKIAHNTCKYFRTDDGEMFVVKDPDLFASEVIPQYFDHNKFSSFARQLNFYGACLTTVLIIWSS